LPTLHVHLDESGDFNFSPRGTAFYTFAVAWTFDPLPLAQAVSTLRFALLKEGADMPAFHAAPDRQKHRDRLVQTIVAQNNWRFAALVVEKRKTNPLIRDPVRFYPHFLTSCLKFVIRGRLAGADRVMIFTDSLPFQGSRKKREAVEKAIKMACAAELPRGFPFFIYHHPKESNAWIQVADYCTWAVFRKWESKDGRTYDQLRSKLAARELDALKWETTLYY
jgi:Protein of unknown function (DUF3800)